VIFDRLAERLVNSAYLKTSRDAMIWTNHEQVFCVEVEQLDLDTVVTYGEPSVDTVGVVLMTTRQCSYHLTGGELVEANDADKHRVLLDVVWNDVHVAWQMLNDVQLQTSLSHLANRIAQSQQLLYYIAHSRCIVRITLEIHHLRRRCTTSLIEFR